jgi:hypothetical protein
MQTTKMVCPYIVEGNSKRQNHPVIKVPQTRSSTGLRRTSVYMNPQCHVKEKVDRGFYSLIQERLSLNGRSPLA